MVSRRHFLSTGLLAGGALAAPAWLRGPVFAQTSEAARPGVPWGVQSGDATPSSAVVWSATDRPARMLVEYSTDERFSGARRLVGPAALPETGYTAKVVLADLPSGREVFYRVVFQDLGDLKTLSAPVTGRLRTAPAEARDVSFVWSGDTAGQGWGINREWGGMKIYEAMRGLASDFFVHSGDMIYADGPIKTEVALPGGAVWKNLTTEAKSKVAETLEEFRGNYQYNLMDENVRRFGAEIAQYVQWDDHEVTNNWFHERILEDDRYKVKSCALLASRARRAMFEFTPIAVDAQDHERVYRAVHRGPLLDLFMLDMRSYRGPNTENRQTTLPDEARILGAAQSQWLKRALHASRATWKVIAADMPLGLVVYHDASRKWGSEAVAQGDGPALGRELEIADLLRFIKQNDIGNVVWITADVHYCATHLYEPARAQFTDFAPFYEFVSGPLHAGGFGPNELDNTFGPRVVFTKHPSGRANTPPTEGGLYFGHVKIDGRTQAMTVTHRDLAGTALHETQLTPQA
ncbi:MAG TPA: alkaline phosphatase D family protein [Methylomirabilota bacterium]